MQPLAQAGYLDTEVLDALRRRSGSSTVTFRYEHLDSGNKRLGDLANVLSGSVTFDYLADIKRTAKFQLADTGGINYLSDRIRPWARIALPSTDDTLDDELGAVPGQLLRWMFDGDSTVAVDSSGSGHDGAITSGGVTTGRPALIEVGSAYQFDTSASASVAATGASGMLDGLDAVTVVSWIRADSTGHDRGWVSGLTVPGSADMSMGARFAASGALGGAADCIRVFAELGDGTLVAAETGANTATTHTTNVIWSWQSGVGIRVWLDGQPAALSGKTNFDTVGALSNVDGFVVGYSPNGSTSGSGGFGGTVDEVSAYSTMLDDATALAIYRAGAQVGPYGSTNFAEWPQGVFLLTSPTRVADIDGVVVRDVAAYDAALVLDDDKADNRASAASGTAYTDQVLTLLHGAGITDVTITPSQAVIPTTIEWDPGTPKLRMVNDLLAAINFESVWFDETGRCVIQPYVSPQDRPSEFTYAADSTSVIGQPVQQSLDLFGVPNKWVLVVSEPDRAPIVSTFTNNDPASPTSVPSRGRTIVKVITNQTAPSRAIADGLATRTGFEASQVYEEITLPTGLMPIHSHNNVYTLVYPDLGVSDTYSERQWTLPCKAGATMTHIIRRVVTVG